MTAQAILRPLALLAAGAIAVAACGGTTATTVPGAGTVAPATLAPASVAPATEAPAASGAAPSLSLPSFQGDQELEGMLPDTLGGETVTVLSLTGEEFLGGGMGSGTEDLQALLTQLGKAPSDMSVAFGGAGTVTIVAFRIKGVPSATIFQSLKSIAEQEGAATITDMNLGGKAVQKMVPADLSETSYIYGTGDVVFVVGGTDITDAQLNEAFSKLP